MKKCKTWLIIGAADGLGPAAAKYLSAHGQQVITLEDCMIAPSLEIGMVDHIINNSNYKLFHSGHADIAASAKATMSLLTSLTRWLKQDPPGTIINLPPQLCLASLDDPSAGLQLQHDLDLFLTLIRQGLGPLGFPLTLLEPGERLF